MDKSKTFPSKFIASLSRIDKPTVGSKLKLLAGGLSNMEKVRRDVKKMKEYFKEVLRSKESFSKPSYQELRSKAIDEAMKSFNTLSIPY